MKEPVFRRQPQQQRSQARVEQILKAAAEVFWEVGYDAATTHAIAHRAKTAVGTLYRFFPNKLAIFHELEKRHRQGVEATHTRMMTPEFMRKPLPDMVQQMVETYAHYFEDVGHRVVYVQYHMSPEMFVHFDNAVDDGFIRRFAGMLRMSNAALSVEKSELLAEVCHRSFNALLLSALRSDATHRAQLYLELQALLTNYLQPHLGTHRSSDEPVRTAERVAAIAQQHPLNPRQQKALTSALEQGSLTIQMFESICPGLSRRTLQRDLRHLVNQSLLQSEGETNQLVYRPGERLG
ncbi:MAG: TetR/AcrR family transcriptional regulator [Phormidesmis sp.]